MANDANIRLELLRMVAKREPERDTRDLVLLRVIDDLD